MMYLHVNELRPTQMTIGARYVSAKALLTDRHSNDTNAFMERHAVRVALGPGHSFLLSTITTGRAPGGPWESTAFR